jgi:hypothetical protein
MLEDGKAKIAIDVDLGRQPEHEFSPGLYAGYAGRAAGESLCPATAAA